MDKDTVQFINVTKALDPNTSSKELDELYEINDSEVIKALALNPNTSRETLLKMYQRYTKEEYGFNLKISINLVLNKNFPIDHLAEAVKTLIGRMSYRTVEENIKEVNELLDKVLYELDRSNLPIKFITDAQVYDERVEYRKKKGGYGITRPILALKINRITQKAERLFKKYRTPIEGELGGVIPKENDGRILYSSKEAELAINPNTPIETLTELGLNNKDIYVKQLVASNPSITPELIDKMFDDIKSYSYEGTYAMYELLLNPNFPMKKYYKCLREAQIHILYRFNGVISYWKKCWKKLARELDNPNCPIELIEDIIEGSKITRMSSTDIFMYDKNPYKSIMNSITQKAIKIYKDPERRSKLTQRTYEEREAIKTKNYKAELQQKNINMKQQEEAETRRKTEIDKKKVRLRELLSELKDLNEAIAVSEYKDVNTIDYSTKTQIPDSALFITVGEHREINPEYIPYLPYIDLSYVDSTNLKVSGIDWSNTNISIDPQKVFMKDLSNAKFSDANIVFKSFDECNLAGTDISDEKDSTLTENIIVDENTKLPETNKRTV